MSHQDGKGFTGPGPEAEFWRYVAEGRFMIQHCKDCGGYIYFPRVLCPHCGSPDLEAREASGRGTVYSTTVVRRKPGRGGDLNVVLVDLEEGPRMMSRVENIAPDKVQIGMAVTARVVARDDGTIEDGNIGDGNIVVFVPAGGGEAP